MRKSVMLLRATMITCAFLCGALPGPQATLTARPARASRPQQVESSAAQQGSEQPKRLALQIMSDDGRPTSYTAVPLPGAKTKGVWFGKYNREPPVRFAPPTTAEGQLQRANARPSAAVKFVPEMEGDAVRVGVSVLLGRYLDTEKAVASFLIRENETVSVPGLEPYNVAAFKVKVVKVLPSIGEPPPAVVSKAKSIEVVRVEALESTMPSSNVKLRNTSDKAILAIDIKIGAAIARPQGLEGRNLIEPGAVYALGAFAAASGTMMPEGYLPVGPAQIVINTAVFADGTYEGEFDPPQTTWRLEREPWPNCRDWSTCSTMRSGPESSILQR